MQPIELLAIAILAMLLVGAIVRHEARIGSTVIPRQALVVGVAVVVTLLALGLRIDLVPDETEATVAIVFVVVVTLALAVGTLARLADR